MGQLTGKVAVVAGGSRGLGRGIVEALAANGASVLAVGRNSETLETLKQEVEGVQTLAADITDVETTRQIFRERTPDIFVLSAGATPHMAPIQEQSWEQFSNIWNNDVQATFHLGKEALLAPLPQGSVVITLSSGAAIAGSPLSGGYAGAKRMQWFLTKYFQQEANAANLGIRFLALLPKQIIGDTELGHAAASGYAERQGITKAKFLERFGEPLGPDGVGQGVMSLLTDPAYESGTVYTITGKGMELVE